jgi:coiled-coil domain-containing protein 40
LKRGRELNEQQLNDARKAYQERQQVLNSERKKGADLRAELENISLRIFYLENAKKDVRSDIAVMKRAAEKAESEVSKAEEGKRQQDLYVSRLVERLDHLREDIALFDAQLEAQMAETKVAREALFEAKSEIESIAVEKKQLFAAWNSALIGMRRRDEAHAAMSEALKEQQQRMLTIEMEIDAFRRLTQKEQQQNEQLTSVLNKTEGEIQTVKKMLSQCQVMFCYKMFGASVCHLACSVTILHTIVQIS